MFSSFPKANNAWRFGSDSPAPRLDSIPQPCYLPWTWLSPPLDPSWFCKPPLTMITFILGVLGTRYPNPHFMGGLLLVLHHIFPLHLFWWTSSQLHRSLGSTPTVLQWFFLFESSWSHRGGHYIYVARQTGSAGNQLSLLPQLNPDWLSSAKEVLPLPYSDNFANQHCVSMWRMMSQILASHSRTAYYHAGKNRDLVFPQWCDSASLGKAALQSSVKWKCTVAVLGRGRGFFAHISSLWIFLTWPWVMWICAWLLNWESFLPVVHSSSMLLISAGQSRFHHQCQRSAFESNTAFSRALMTGAEKAVRVGFCTSHKYMAWSSPPLLWSNSYFEWCTHTDKNVHSKYARRPLDGVYSRPFCAKGVKLW